ncbi:MAG: class I SAM-dependent methyltransferase [Methylococcaceae bacterium]
MEYGYTTCILHAVSKEVANNRELYRCSDCGSITVAPTPATEQVKEYYESYAYTRFDDGSDWRKRKSYRVIQNICNIAGKGAILDIGCGDGRLLNMLPLSFRKFGIDVSENACSLARGNGVTALCSTLESAKFREKFDVVLALDFIEHTVDPREAIKIISDLIKPGGHVIIETGNASSLTAEFLKEDWSYVSVYGHLCALTPGALSKLACEVGISQIYFKKSWHTRPTLKLWVYRNILAYGFHAFRIMYRMAVPIASRFGYLRKLYMHAPPGAPNPDHMIFVGKKKL